MTESILRWKVCRYCGKTFQREKSKAQTYCSDECRKRGYEERCRKWHKLMWRRRKALGLAEYRNKLNDTSIVVLDGQERVKGAIILEKMIKKKKKDDFVGRYA